MINKVANKSFTGKNWAYFIILAIFCVIGMKNNVGLFAAIGVILIAMATSSIEHKFCWSLFLIPNIRIFDNLGTTSIVNVLLIVPLAFYVIRKLFRGDIGFMVFPIISAFFLYAFEEFHIMANYMKSDSLFGWILSFITCAYFTLDEEIHIRGTDAARGLIAGIIFSTVMYFFANPEYMNGIIQNIVQGERFAAYGDDPNYFSLYICLSLACIVTKYKLSLLDYLLIAILVCIGFLTASKMCMFVMVLLLAYLIFVTNGNISKMQRGLLVLVVLAVTVTLFWEYIVQFFDNLFNRAGGSKITLNSLTTGRFNIVSEYLQILYSDASTLLFGKGFSYHLFLNTLSLRGAHNTYLDIILAWGVVGTAFFIGIISRWLRLYKKRFGEKCSYTTQGKIPFFVLLLCFFALSCFSAGMFFFIISLCILQLHPKREEAE